MAMVSLKKTQLLLDNYNLHNPKKKGPHGRDLVSSSSRG